MTDRRDHRVSEPGPAGFPAAVVGAPAGSALASLASRRDLLRWAALAAGTLGAAEVLAACGAGGGGASAQQAAAGSLRALTANVSQLQLLSAQSEVPAGRTSFTFGLAGPTNALVDGAAPQLWLARDQTSRAQGPFPARWLELTAYDKTGDRSPRSELKGFYVAEVDLPDPGNWLGVAMVEVASQRAAGQGAIPVKAQVPAQVGTKARSGPSPVATSPREIAKICTREPVCPMHYISLDQALRSGRPTVVSFSTPLLCTSRMCGPVLDEHLVVFGKLGKARANFIHVEIYPQRDTNKPAPLYVDWGFTAEPDSVVIDRGGIIRSRREGALAASEIETALQPLLS